MAAILIGHGMFEQAERHICEAIALGLADAEIFAMLGLVLSKRGRLDEAAAVYRRALELRPDDPVLLNDLAIALMRQCRFDDALNVCRRAVTADPNSPDSFNNLGVALLECDRIEESGAALERALDLRPGSPDILGNIGMRMLLLGDFRRGWPLFATRWSDDRDEQIVSRQKPRWRGQELRGRTLLVYEEDGYGDVLQFVRFIAPLAREGARVILQCPARMKRLIETVEGLHGAVGPGEPLPEFDFHAPLLDLPLVLSTSLSDIPSAVPYLRPEEERVQRWARRMRAIAGFKIGIAWHADPRHDKFARRCIPLASFEPLAKLPGVTLINLQKGPGADQIASVPFPVIELDPARDSEPQGAFLDTAAIIANLDLVVTADTSVAHLAGALGAPVWVALPKACEWRWMRGRPDSPWYPTMRLFRQREHWQWATVFEEIAAETARTLDAFSEPSSPPLLT
jgi:Flp pilus assembly protein TadD